MVRANSGPKRYETPQNPTITFEELGAKTGRWEPKQGTVITPTHNTTRGVGKPPKLPLGLDS